MDMLTRWEPFRGAISLREAIDRLFDESFLRPFGEDWMTLWPERGIGVPVDMYETDNEVVVKASIPGIKPEDVNITVTDDLLTIKGETKEEQEVERGSYHLRERRYGAFERCIRLPVPVKADKAEAVFQNGVLTLTLPKVEKARTKTIKVKVK